MVGSILVAQGDASSLSSIGNYESSFREGDYGCLDLHLAVAPPSLIKSAADGLNAFLLNKFEGYRLDVYPSLLRVHFKRGIAPLLIIALAVAAVILLVGIVLAWKLYKMSPAAAVVSIASLVFAFALAGVAVVASLVAIRKYAT